MISEALPQLTLKNFSGTRINFREIRNFLAGQFLGATRDDVLLDEVLKCLFCKLHAENKLQQHPSPEFLASNAPELFDEVKRTYPEIFDASSEFLLSRAISLQVFERTDFPLLESDYDPVSEAFEVFVGSESKSRAGQFFTPSIVTDFLVDAISPRIDESIVDPACGAGTFLTSAVRSLARQGHSKENLSRFCELSLFGIDKDAFLVRLAKVHLSLLTTGHASIKFGDSLSLHDGISTFAPKVLGKFDVVLTNPPFGAKIIAASPDVLQGFELARKWTRDDTSGFLVPGHLIQSNVPPQVLFVERCISLLKEGGRLGIVLPESLVSNKSYRQVVEYITSRCSLDAVIGMPEALFKTSGKGGTHTKTCLLVCHKSRPAQVRTVFMAEARHCGHDSRARRIPLNDLPEISSLYGRFREGEELPTSWNGFLTSSKEIAKTGILAPKYYDPEIARQGNSLVGKCELVSIKDLIDDGTLEYQTGDEVGKLAYGTGDIPFVRTSDISNWEIKADPKHSVSRDIFEGLKRKQDVRAGDLLMVKDGTYLVGTCALVTVLDTALVYQSHLYKIRVNANSRGLDCFNLLALLSTDFVQLQIKAKRLTQDIIDSLGERIKELLLPLPQSKVQRDRISEQVKEVIELRVAARKRQALLQAQLLAALD